MSGGTRIVAFEPGNEAAPAAEDASFEASKPDPDSGAWDHEDFAEWNDPVRTRLLPSLVIAAMVAWTVLFVAAEWDILAGGASVVQIASLIGSWTMPILLLCAIWLLLLQNGRHELARFGDAARLLAHEASQLEARIATINQELSLAREFIAAQSRDLESLGRLASERLSENAQRLQDLIQANGAQVEAIAGVSSTALDNMERLRGQLPVVASSAKDVANTIGHAGRTAEEAMQALAGELDRVSAAGTSGGEAIHALHARVEASLALFDGRLDEIQTAIVGRVTMLEDHAAELRQRLANDENEALSALGRRAETLRTEFEQTRGQLDAHEAEAITSLRARLSALRDEGAVLARALREGEEGALQALLAAKDRVEQEIRSVVERLDTLDRQALDAATMRIKQLSDEAATMDSRLAERNARFTEELERRLGQASERHDREAARITDLFVRLDDDLAERQQRQSALQQELADSSALITARVESLAERIAAIAAFGTQAEESLGQALATLGSRLTSSREALVGTDATIAQLNGGAERLLDLLQASTRQSREDLTSALGAGEGLLVEWERRVSKLQATVAEAGERGEALQRSVTQSHSALEETVARLDALQQQIEGGTTRHAEAIGEIRQSLASIEQDSATTAQAAIERLGTAMGGLEASARAMASGLGEETSGMITQLADRLGEASAAAIDRVMRARMAEAVGALEQAAAQAAGVSREAAIHLRDQLAKVNELTGNLEQRVAYARQRAEEQVDADFSRRVALITESLNSNSIDIAKALSAEVTDTAWAAYLKGDRGIFTRRALKLVDAAAAREILEIYEKDQDFRGHVSRYIHDFEAMLRQLLSTRDGHALGVTLLSSDMGKLYVALAQAIERLRT